MDSTVATPPPTAAASAAMSVVVATTRKTAAAGAAASMAAASTRLKSPARITLSGSHPRALRKETVDRLLRSDGHSEAAVHHHARKAVGIEAAQAFLLLQQLDHRPCGVVHRLVEIGVLADGDKVSL